MDQHGSVQSTVSTEAGSRGRKQPCCTCGRLFMLTRDGRVRRHDCRPPDEDIPNRASNPGNNHARPQMPEAVPGRAQPSRLARRRRARGEDWAKQHGKLLEFACQARTKGQFADRIADALTHTPPDSRLLPRTGTTDPLREAEISYSDTESDSNESGHAVMSHQMLDEKYRTLRRHVYNGDIKKYARPSALRGLLISLILKCGNDWLRSTHPSMTSTRD